MLQSAKLFRRHTPTCKDKLHLGEDAVESCECNLGYKGTDPTSGKFRRLMFIPAVKDQRRAWRCIVDMEQDKAADGSAALNAKDEALGDSHRQGALFRASREKVLISAAFEEYIKIVQVHRNVKESSIYAHWRPVKNAIVRLADSRGLKYIDELRPEFVSDVLVFWQHLSINRRGDCRRTLEDFCNFARRSHWTDYDLAERLMKPARGKAHTEPENPTVPFDLETEMPRILAAIPSLDLGKSAHPRRPSFWKAHPQTGRAFIYLLDATGLRKGDAALFDPRCLEKRTLKDRNGIYRDAYVRTVPKQKKTDAPVFVVIPFEIGEYIRQAPRLSEEYAFIPPGRTTGNKFRAWISNISTELFRPLEKASGVAHIHAHPSVPI